MIIARAENGEIVVSSGRPPAKIDMEQAVKLYQQHLSINQVAIMMGTNRSILQRRFQKLGISKDKGWYNRGRKLSDETRSKISASWKLLMSDLIILERLRIGKNNPFYGKKHKPETIEAMKRKLSILLTGERNPQWRGGISLEPYDRTFKKIRYQIYLRDDYRCQECGVQYKPYSGRLVAHHRDANKNNSSMSNLITLCRICHAHITQMWQKKGGMTHDNS